MKTDQIDFAAAEIARTILDLQAALARSLPAAARAYFQAQYTALCQANTSGDYSACETLSPLVRAILAQI